jgi:hypothetical protein
VQINILASSGRSAILSICPNLGAESSASCQLVFGVLLDRRIGVHRSLPLRTSACQRTSQIVIECFYTIFSVTYACHRTLANSSER